MLADTLDCQAAHMQANDQTRRLFNQAFFAQIYIDEGDETRQRSVRVDYNEPFDSLPPRLIPAGVHRDLETKQTAHRKTPVGDTAGQPRGIAEVQVSHTSTLVEVMPRDTNRCLILRRDPIALDSTR